MTPRFDSFSIITADLAASLAFYRRLGLDIPDGAESAPHVEVHLPGGQRLLWDTEQVIAALDPEWKRPAGGERLALAFACDSAREVDTLYAELVAPGTPGTWSPGTPRGASATRWCWTRTAAGCRCSPPCPRVPVRPAMAGSATPGP